MSSQVKSSQGGDFTVPYQYRVVRHLREWPGAGYIGEKVDVYQSSQGL